MKRGTIVAFAIVAAVLTATAPVAGQSAGLVVASQHTTDGDFMAGDLSGVTVHETGNSAFVAATDSQSQTVTATDVGVTSTQSLDVGGDLGPQHTDGGDPILEVTANAPSNSYNPVIGEGAGSTDSTEDAIGDYSTGATFNTEVKVVPTYDGEIQTITVGIEGVSGSDYGANVDVYLVEEGPDETHGEGTHISTWDPDWTTGEQTIQVDSPPTVSGGKTYSLEFVTDSVSGDGGDDYLSIGTDTSASSTWMVAGAGSGTDPLNKYADVEIKETDHVNDLSVSDGDGTTLSIGDMEDGETLTKRFDLSTSSSSLDWSGSGSGSINYSLQWQEIQYDGKGSYVSDSHDGVHADQGYANLSLENAEAHVRYEYHDGSSWQLAKSSTHSTSGNHTVDISGFDADTWRTNVTFSDASGETTANLNDEGILFAPRSPNITSASPDPDGEASQSEIELSADVEDPDFGTAQGDTVTAEFYLDGESVDTQTISSNGTVSTTVEPSLGGTHNWSVELTDSYGNTNSIATRDFYIPSELEVAYETEPETLVDEDNLTLTMQFFPLGEGDIETREVTDGTVDLTGLPVDERFVVTVRANESDKFVYRRIVLNSIYDSERIFLLRGNETTDRVIFELNDPTGQFPPEETELFVEKPITINGSTDYYPIAGDTFGATARFPVELMSGGDRYRLRVRSGDDERVLGAFTPSGSTIEPLQIQRIQPSADEENTGSVYGSLTQTNNTSSLGVRFRGGEPGTEVTYEVTDGDGSVVVPETSTVATDFAHVYEFDRSGTQSYNVSYEIVYPDGETQAGYFLAGEIGGIADRFNVDPQVLSIMSWGAILATMGLIVIVDRKLAPAAGTGMASALAIIGTVAIPMPILGVAGAVSVLTIFGGRQ